MMKKGIIVVLAVVFCFFSSNSEASANFFVGWIVSSVVVGVNKSQQIEPEMSLEFRSRFDAPRIYLPKYDFGDETFRVGLNVKGFAFGLSYGLTERLSFLAGIEDLPATKPLGYHDADKLDISSKFGVVFSF